MNSKLGEINLRLRQIFRYFLSYLSWLNRENSIVVIGYLTLILAACSPWYRLPPGALEIFEINLFWINAARVIPALFALTGLTFTIFWGISRVLKKLFLTGLITMLLFPYLIVTWFPTVTFISESYYNQVENVTRHIEENFPQVQSQWKQRISLPKTDAPSSTWAMKVQDSRFFQIPSLEQIVTNVFGYKNSFFTFVGRGWVFTIAGLSICLIGFYLVDQRNVMAAFIKDINFLLPGTILVLTLILASVISVNIVNYRLDTDFAKGDYQQVIATSKVLSSWYPSVQGDEIFLERLARAEFSLNTRKSALINFVKGLENYRINNFQQAELHFKDSLDRDPTNFLTRGYLTSALLNQGSNYLNDPDNRKSATAIDFFEKSLKIFPEHMQALYYLMLARVVNGQFHDSADVAKKILDEKKYFQNIYSYKTLVGQAYLHLSWGNFKKDNLENAWQRYFQSTGEVPNGELRDSVED